jgi:two-component system response regulator FixJ
MTQTDRIVHVIDDDDAVRDSIAFLLGTEGLAVRAYESAESFLAAGIPPDGCVVTDIRMPGITGIDLLARIKRANPRLPVVVITGHGDIPLAVEAMKLGAAEFLEKPFEDETLLGAVLQALSRQARDRAHDAEIAAIGERVAALSQRERQVLSGLLDGAPNKTIAFDLGISPRTVEIYRANLMTKMQAASLSDLVRMAIMAGLLDKTAAGGESG